MSPARLTDLSNWDTIWTSIWSKYLIVRLEILSSNLISIRTPIFVDDTHPGLNFVCLFSRLGLNLVAVTNLSLTYNPTNSSVLVRWADDCNTMMPDLNLTYLLSYNISITSTDIVLLTNDNTIAYPEDEMQTTFSEEISSAGFIVEGVSVCVTVTAFTLSEEGPANERSVDVGGSKWIFVDSALLSIATTQNPKEEVGGQNRLYKHWQMVVVSGYTDGLSFTMRPYKLLWCFTKVFQV